MSKRKKSSSYSKEKVFRGPSKTPDETTIEEPKESPYNFDHGQQTSLISYQQSEAEKIFHESFNMHQDQYMMKADINAIKSYIKSYVSTIFALLTQQN